MPVYNYECSYCKGITEHYVSYAARQSSLDCPLCGSEKSAEYRITAPLVGTPKLRHDQKAIYSEKQIEAEHGPNWRDKGTTRKEGGAGKRLYFHD